MRKLFLLANIIMLCCCVSSHILYDVAKSTQPKYPAYGKALNPERVKRGIPVIPEDWEFWHSSEFDVWGNPGGDYLETQKEPLHEKKTLGVQDKNTIVERDRYLGPDTGEIRECVVVECLYHLDNPEVTYCEASAGYLYFKDFDDITMDRAIEILTQWGLSFP